jgi:hypothetical protein
VPSSSAATIRDWREVRRAILASLGVLEVAPDLVTVPLLAAAYRAPLPLLPDCSGWLYGPSGAMKTTLCALAQQHFGPGMDGYALPGNWTSTANHLEMQAFTLAGVLYTVDDFSPDLTTTEARKRAATADRLLRGSANHSARGRLTSNATMRPAKPPRAQILTSAEDLPPAGPSLRARVMVSEVPRGVVKLGPLGAAQDAASAGDFALAMAGYVRWLAKRYELLRDSLPGRLAVLRDKARAGGHPRVAQNIASLMLGWEQWLDYAAAAGAIDAGQHDQLPTRAWKALTDLGAGQERYQRDASPADAYLHALAALVTSGRAHLAGKDGGPPADPGRYGWRMPYINWEPQGDLIGWVSGEGVFLDSVVAYKAARMFTEAAGVPLGVSRYALHQQLRDRSLLATDGGPGQITVQRRLGSRRHDVLHLSADSFDGGA